MADLQNYPTSIANQYHKIYHDVVQRCWLAVKALLCHYGYDAEGSTRGGADNIVAHFTYWRSQIEITALTHITLAILAEKVPLAAITNGNADPMLVG